MPDETPPWDAPEAVLPVFPGRLSVDTVRRLEKVLGGDPAQEYHVLRFIEKKWKAKSLFYISELEASRIIAKPMSFLMEAGGE